MIDEKRMEQEKVRESEEREKTIRSLATKMMNRAKECMDDDRVDERKLRQFQAVLEEKAAKLRQLNGEILNYLYGTDAEDEICENEAEKGHEIQENLTYL